VASEWAGAGEGGRGARARVSRWILEQWRSGFRAFLGRGFASGVIGPVPDEGASW